MSGTTEIAAVTAALRGLLAEGIATEPDLADTVFTTQPPDIARTDGVTSNQLNLFLYRTAVNPAWSNRNLPGRDDVSLSTAPLALTLSYLLTAYGRDNDSRQPFGHLLLGRAMGLLHDNPVLTAELLDAAQPVRLTLQPLSLDDVSKLWSGFQTHYRLSVAYEASVVLIESTRPSRAPPPALRLAIGSRPDANLPVLEGTERGAAPWAGGKVTLLGRGLAGVSSVRLSRDDQVWDLPATPSVDGRRLTIPLPTKNGPAAGWCMASTLPGDAGALASNTLHVAVAAQIASTLPMTHSLAKGPLKLELAAPIGPAQTASLLLGAREWKASPRKAAERHLLFDLTGIAPGEYMLRLRVDGIDTVHVINDAVPAFDADARVTVKP